MKRAMITGVTGQDGSYLAELLLEKGYEVHGIKRRASSFNTGRVDHLYLDPLEQHTRFYLHYGDLTDSTNLIRLVQEIQPDEIYNLAAQSHVKVSFETAEYTANADGLGTLRLLEAIRLLGLKDRARFYQASTSELYGKVREIPQRETTPFYPRSPYAAAKAYAYWITVNYREAYGMFASNGILFNHESPRRGETFVTRKITRGAVRVALGMQGKIHLGNLNARRDWGHAKDFAEAMWLILQAAEPDDFVVATGEDHSVREFAECAFAELGISLEWQGAGADEQGVVTGVDEERLSSLARRVSGWNGDRPRRLPLTLKPGIAVAGVDAKYFRPAEVETLLGDFAKARRQLGWQPRIPFGQLVSEMVSADLVEALRDLHLLDAGFAVRRQAE